MSILTMILRIELRLEDLAKAWYDDETIKENKS